jgi:hypothetical protein
MRPKTAHFPGQLVCHLWRERQRMKNYRKGSKDKSCATCGFSKIDEFNPRKIYCDQRYITARGFDGYIGRTFKKNVCDDWFKKGAPQTATNSADPARKDSPKLCSIHTPSWDHSYCTKCGSKLEPVK